MEVIESKRRLIYAASHLSSEIPLYWNVVASFSNQASSKETVTPESARIVIENLQALNPRSFITDAELKSQLMQLEYSITKQPLGIPLVPIQTRCVLCNGKLLVRNDRPSQVMLYTELMGTVPGTHFHKYSQNYRKGCGLVQFYGYHKNGHGSDRGIQYNSDWMTLPYFLSTQETGFELSMLKKYDAELLIGQLSYKQKADIYNLTKGFDHTKKQCSTSETEKSDKVPPVHR